MNQDPQAPPQQPQPTPHNNDYPPVPPAQDGDQPVAYDTQGRPLYLHPSAPPAPQQTPGQPPMPQVVYMARPMEPAKVHISDEAMRRHEESSKKYPFLNLSKGEYVISAVKRHPIGLLSIWAIVAFLALAFTAMGVMIFTGSGSLASTMSDAEDLPALVAGSLGFLYVLLALGGMAATYIYEQNKFFLTNESVIQEIQTSLFDKHEQTVSLGNIEDASYQKKHVIESIFNYGSIRLSTEGDETTYRFDFVANPKKHIAVLNNAVEAFKNGRPVEG